MAKRIELHPAKKETDNSLDNKSLADIIRLAIDGNEEAKEKTFSILNLFEEVNMKYKDLFNLFDNALKGRLPSHNLDLFSDEDENDEDYDDYDEYRFDVDIDFPITLKRNNVKEYHVRIKLNDIDLKIWREVKVPSNITLEALANLLLDVMGWDKEHLFCFQFKNIEYCSKEELEDAIFMDAKDFARVTLSDVLTEKGVRMKLLYDYGDDWKHDVWVKGIREYDKGEKPSITYFTGNGACPPEDCGGVGGYLQLIELTKKKKLTAEDRERLDWYCMYDRDGYDPEECDHEYYDAVAEDYDDSLQEENE